MRRVGGLLAVVVLGLSLLLAGTARADGADDATFLRRTNGDRAANGLPALRAMGDLAQVAQGQAARMAAADAISHNPNLATEVKNWRMVGENVARGSDADSIHAALMASPHHRANLLSRDFTEIGIGTVRKGTVLYVSEVFRQPAAATPAASAPAPAPVKPAPPPRPAAARPPAPHPAPVAPAPVPSPAPVPPTPPPPPPVPPPVPEVAAALFAAGGGTSRAVPIALTPLRVALWAPATPPTTSRQPAASLAVVLLAGVVLLQLRLVVWPTLLRPLQLSAPGSIEA